PKCRNEIVAYSFKRFGIWVVFFFQAEDGIRDFHVTGVQTCALPISTSGIERRGAYTSPNPRISGPKARTTCFWLPYLIPRRSRRSEERRVGKECRSWWWRCHYKKRRRDSTY